MSTPWRDMTEDQKARKRESARHYRMTVKGRAKRYETRKRWNEQNRERKRENDRKWYARKKDHAEWISDKTAMVKNWRENNREKYRSAQLKWLSEHPGYMSEWRSKRKILWAKDPVAYSEHREQRRLWNQLNRKSGMKPYRPRVSMRIPDYLCFGQSECIRRKSAYLWENLSKERQLENVGYARQVARERKGRR